MNGLETCLARFHQVSDNREETQGDERYADPEPEMLRAVLRQKTLKEIEDHFNWMHVLLPFFPATSVHRRDDIL